MLEALLIGSTIGLQDAPSEIDFKTHIQPILEARCVKCHGPKRQRGKLRLDQRDGVLGEGAESHLLVPGDPAASEIYVRISLDEDHDDLMPADGDPLPDEQIDLVRRWIEAGAEWDDAPEDVAAEVDRLQMQALDESEQAAEAKAIDAVNARGGRAARVAQSTTALDVNLSLASPAVTDEDLKMLAGMEKTLAWLNLSRSQVTSKGVGTLASYSELRRLQLARSAVDDSGLAALVKLKRLTHLNLYGTRVTDAGIDELARMPALERVYLWQTEVTEAGAARLQAARPELRIVLGRAAVATPATNEKTDEGAGDGQQ